MAKGRILIDMDEVLSDCITHWINELNETHGLSLERSKVDDWRIERSTAFKNVNLTKRQIFQPMNLAGFFSLMKPMPESKEGVQELLDEGFELAICSSLPAARRYAGQMAQEKLDWLRTHFPYFIETRNVVFTKRKEFVAGDLLIDDAPHNILSYPGKTIVFDHPHNQKVEGTKRVKCWNEMKDACLEALKLKERNDSKNPARPLPQ